MKKINTKLLGLLVIGMNISPSTYASGKLLSEFDNILNSVKESMKGESNIVKAYKLRKETDRLTKERFERQINFLNSLKLEIPKKKLKGIGAKVDGDKIAINLSEKYVDELTKIDEIFVLYADQYEHLLVDYLSEHYRMTSSSGFYSEFAQALHEIESKGTIDKITGKETVTEIFAKSYLQIKKPTVVKKFGNTYEEQKTIKEKQKIISENLNAYKKAVVELKNKEKGFITYDEMRKTYIEAERLYNGFWNSGIEIRDELRASAQLLKLRNWKLESFENTLRGFSIIDSSAKNFNQTVLNFHKELNEVLKVSNNKQIIKITKNAITSKVNNEVKRLLSSEIEEPVEDFIKLYVSVRNLHRTNPSFVADEVLDLTNEVLDFKIIENGMSVQELEAKGIVLNKNNIDSLFNVENDGKWETVRSIVSSKSEVTEIASSDLFENFVDMNDTLRMLEHVYADKSIYNSEILKKVNDEFIPEVAQTFIAFSKNVSEQGLMKNATFVSHYTEVFLRIIDTIVKHLKGIEVTKTVASKGYNSRTSYTKTLNAVLDSSPSEEAREKLIASFIDTVDKNELHYLFDDSRISKIVKSDYFNEEYLPKK